MGSLLCRGLPAAAAALTDCCSTRTGASVTSGVQELALACRWSLPVLVDSALSWEKSSFRPGLGHCAPNYHNRPLLTPALVASHTPWKPFSSAAKPPPSTDTLHSTPLLPGPSVPLHSCCHDNISLRKTAWGKRSS